MPAAFLVAGGITRLAPLNWIGPAPCGRSEDSCSHTHSTLCAGPSSRTERSRRWIPVAVMPARGGLLGLAGRRKGSNGNGLTRAYELFPILHEFRSRHEVRVDADAARADRALREVTFKEVPLVRALLFARGLGLSGGTDRVLSTMVPRASVLEDVPGEGIVLSLTGRFWRLRGRGRDTPATAVVDFRARQGLLSTETRVVWPVCRSYRNTSSVPFVSPATRLLATESYVTNRPPAEIEGRTESIFPWWPLLSALLLIPPFLRDSAYDLLARNRYRWFGKREACRMPTPELRARFLE